MLHPCSFFFWSLRHCVLHSFGNVQFRLVFLLAGTECHFRPGHILWRDRLPGGAGHGEDHPAAHEQERCRPRSAGTVQDLWVCPASWRRWWRRTTADWKPQVQQAFRSASLWSLVMLRMSMSQVDAQYMRLQAWLQSWEAKSNLGEILSALTSMCYVFVCATSKPKGCSGECK